MVSPAADISGIVVFRMGTQYFGLRVEQVREVVPVAWLDRPPNLSSLVEGILNLGGEAVPVLRLDRLLDQAEGRYGLDASILIMRPQPEQASLGLLVEHVEGVRELEDFRAMGLPAGQSFNDCLVEVLERDGKTVNMLSWKRLLLEQEARNLAEFQGRAQARLDRLADSPS
jgi:purine-binding chemotaxis protein CheW